MTNPMPNAPPPTTNRGWIEPITAWAFAGGDATTTALKGFTLGVIVGFLMCGVTLCWIPCIVVEERNQPEGGWWAFFLRKLKIFFLGRDRRGPEDGNADLEAGAIELEDRTHARDRARREELESREPTVPDVSSGAYMLASPNASAPTQQNDYGRPEEQQRVRDEFRRERENMRREVAEVRRRSAARQNATTQQDIAATNTTQYESYSITGASQTATASHAEAQQSSGGGGTTTNNQQQQTAQAQTPAPPTPPQLTQYQRHNPRDPAHPINMTNADMERERFQREREEARWFGLGPLRALGSR